MSTHVIFYLLAWASLIALDHKNRTGEYCETVEDKELGLDPNERIAELHSLPQCLRWGSPESSGWAQCNR